MSSISKMQSLVPSDEVSQQVLEELHKFRLVVEHTNNMVVITDENQRIEYVNPTYTRVTGWTLDEIRGKKPSHILQGPGTDPKTLSVISQALAKGQGVKDIELLNYNRKGETYWVSLSIQPIRNAQNAITHFVAIQLDITERRKTREALQTSARRLSEAQHIAQIGSFECTLLSGKLHWSDEALDVLADGGIQIPPQDYMAHVQNVHEDDREALLDAHWQLVVNRQAYEIEYRLHATDEPTRWIRERGRFIAQNEHAPDRLSGLIQDITDTKVAHEKIKYLAHHDTLTGLLNRDQLRLQLRTQLLDAQESGKHLAVLFIDLDRFKSINDSLGHHAGDEVLRVVAKRLRESVRTSDLICRLGGDEFVLTLAGIEDPSTVTRLASQILIKLARPMHQEGRELQVTASVGISLFPDHGSTVEDLMRHADSAMYQAKNQGRNTLSHYCPATNADLEHRFEIESRLRHALERDELELFYQPQYETTGWKLIGFEALLRWHPRDGDSVGPDVFIPVAEESGLIGAMGDWVLEQACAQWRYWSDKCRTQVRIAVNVSAQQLWSDKDLVGLVEALLQRYGIPPDMLELELTETVAMRSPEASIELMKRLRLLGVTLAVDDFGTGYSSLGYLKILPIQRLKLDRSFVKDLDVNPNDKAICSATIALAHKLGLEIVGEGVETASQRDYLASQGCNVMQGYLLGRPVPAAQAELLLREEEHDRQP